MSALAIALETGDDVGEANTRLSGLAEQLSNPRRLIEQNFAEMGEQLMGCFQLLNEVSSAHRGLSAELESEAFASAVQTLRSIRDHIAALTVTDSEGEDSVSELTRLAEEVAFPLSDLRKAVRSIRFIAVNARIAAASVKGQQVDLGAFTTDMMELGQGVEKAVSAFADAHTQFVASLRNARAANTTFSFKHGDTTSRISRRLAGHLDVVGEHRARAVVKASEHSHLTDQIRARVGTAISAVQIGDITRQRIEHVEQALAMLVEYLEGGEARDAATHTNTFAAICHLQSMQLDETTFEFEQQILDFEQSLRQLSHDAVAVIHAGNVEAESLLSSGGTALSAILADLREIHELLQDFHRARAGTEQAIGEAASDVVRSVAVMVDQLKAVSAIEHQISLLSFNTVIQCGQLGDEGSALKIIAENLRGIAGQTVEAADAIMTGLGRAEELAQNLTEGQAANAAQRIIELDRDVNSANGSLETVVERLNGHAASLSETGLRAAHQIEHAANSIRGRQELVESCRFVCSELQSLAPAEVAAFDRSAVDMERLGSLRASYTMDSERRLYDSLLGVAPPDTVAGSPAPEPQDELDDIFF